MKIKVASPALDYAVEMARDRDKDPKTAADIYIFESMSPLEAAEAAITAARKYPANTSVYCAQENEEGLELIFFGSEKQIISKLNAL